MADLATRRAASLRLCPREWRRGARLIEQTTRRLELSGDAQGSRKRLAQHLRRTCAAAAALRDDLVELTPPAVCGEPPTTAIPKHPQPTTAEKRREAALREALLAGAMPMRDPHKMSMLKPKVMRYEPDTSWTANCTACVHQRRAIDSARRWVPRVAPGQPVLLLDGAALAAWEGVVHELTAPRKERASFPPSATLGGFGMPGTVLHEEGKYRAWLGQSQQRYFESADGLRFVEPSGQAGC